MRCAKQWIWIADALSVEKYCNFLMSIGMDQT